VGPQNRRARTERRLRIDYFFVSKDIVTNVKDAFILKDVMGSIIVR